MILSPRAVHCAVLLAVVMLSLAVLYADGRGAVPGGRADHRLHRRGADALPVRHHDRRGERRPTRSRETIRGQRLWATAWPPSALLVLLTLVVGHAAIGPAAARLSQLRGDAT